MDSSDQKTKTKEKKAHGIRIRKTKEKIKKYNGVIEWRKEYGMFIVDVLLYKFDKRELK